MPTAAKLVSAVLIGVLGWIAAHLVIPHLPPETRIGFFREITAALGVLVGWRFLGARAGTGMGASLGFGLGAALVLVFWALVTFSGIEMIRRSLRKAYDGPVEGLKNMLAIAIEDLHYLAFPEVWGVLLVGGLAAGVVAEAVARRLP